jgi:hypothetical protein
MAQGNSTVKDVFNHTIDLDSIIINYAGRLGIPPQLIKAQIHQESSFRPAMRYEPFKDAYYQTHPRWKTKFKNNRYWVDSTSNGKPSSPTNHTFWYFGTKKTSYPGYIGSIFDIWNKNQDAYARNIYPGMPKLFDTAVYKPTMKTVLKEHADWKSVKQISYVDSIAECKWSDYLRDKYQGGLKNYPAQTRIMSSYGFLQMMYFIAFTERGYTENDAHLPEVLMETDTSFTYSTRHLIAMFKRKDINENYFLDTGWKLGFDTTWYRALGYYNGSYDTTTHKSKYADAVFRLMKLYLPNNGK